VKSHLTTCPALRDPAAKCFCPPPGHPGTRYTTGADPGTDDGTFELTPPVPVPETAGPGRYGGKPANRSGETRAQTTARLRRTRAAFMIRKYGPGPAAMKCSTCQFLERHGGGRRDYSKCRKYGVSSSESTDWSGKWAACALYQSR
jgi:hypothetical protein